MTPPDEPPPSRGARAGGSDVEWELIDRYLADECTPEQVAEVERLLTARPDLADIVAAFRSTLGADPRANAESGWDADAASARLFRTIAGDAVARHIARPQLRVVSGTARRRQRWVSAAIAAGLVLAASTGILWLETQQRAASPAVAPVREIVTTRGQRAAFNLSDGSRVVLAAESRILIPEGYNTAVAGGRPVFLEGQAYFEVKHDSTNPFEVRTAAGVARDLGTQFAVRAYPETRGMRVAVAEGVVALGTPYAAPLLELVEGDLGKLDTAGVATLTRGANLHPYLAWAEGSLVFDGTRLGDALTELSRWYDLEFQLADPALADRRLTATFTNEPAPQVLERIARVLSLEVRQNGRVVTLVASGSAQASS